MPNDVMLVTNGVTAGDPNEKRIQELEARRAARRAAADASRNAQRATDLEAVDALEEAYGPGGVVLVETDRFIEGLPTMAAFRLPKPIESKRFHDRLKEKGGKGDPIQAGEELAQVCREYPAKTPEGDALWTQLCEAFSQFKTNAGVAVSKASRGVREDEGKE